MPRYFTQDHEWIDVDGDTGTVGITDFAQGQRLGKGDHVALWSRPVRPKWMTPEEYEATPLNLQVRETRVGEWTVISSLKDAKAVSRQDLNELYCWRWHVELDLRHIKETMGMNVLSCKTPDMAVKEIWVYLLAYNLGRIMSYVVAGMLAGGVGAVSYTL